MRYVRSQLTSIMGIVGLAMLALGLLSWPMEARAQTNAQCWSCACLDPNNGFCDDNRANFCGPLFACRCNTWQPCFRAFP